MSSGPNTPNLGLHNWIGTDKVLRGEFNDNFTAIDTFAGQAVKTGNANTFTANQTAPAWIASGLTGAQGTGRWAGVTTAAGAPTSGTFALGDWVLDPFTPAIWVCTSAGTPGAWTSARASNAARTDITNLFSAQQTFENGLEIYNNSGSNGVSGTAPFIWMRNYSTQAGGQATFLSNWAGSNYWGIGAVDTSNVQVGVADGNGKWLTGQAFTFNIGGGLKLTGAVQQVAGQNTAGAFGAVSTLAAVRNQQLTSTAATQVFTFTPTTSGIYRVTSYLRVVTATTNVTLTVAYADSGAAQSYTPAALNNTSVAVGSHGVIDYTFEAVAGNPITLTVTAGTANQVYVTGALEAIA